MNFTEAMEIIKNIIPKCSAKEYDGIVVKRLEASNTLDEGRTTNQTHIAISGEQMDMFPYLMADGYFKCNYDDRDEQLKKYFITQIPLYIYKDNISYLSKGKVKGLEYPVVFVVDLVNQRFPGKKGQYSGILPEALMGNAIDRGAYGNRTEDEARLFYTAITRAERLLYLTGSEIHPELKTKKKQSVFTAELKHSDMRQDSVN